MEKLRRELHDEVDWIIDRHYVLTFKQAKEWLELSRDIGPDGPRTSTLILNLDELDDYRKKPDQPRNAGLGYESWSRRRRQPMH